jgi:hypothetical protein
MPRIKKRKQGLVAKLNSKSFKAQKDAAVVFTIKAQWPKDPASAEATGLVPDYLHQNLTPDLFMGKAVRGEEYGGEAPPETTIERSSAERITPLGVIDLGSIADRRWVLRRFLSALHLDHLKLEKQMYERMYLLSSVGPWDEDFVLEQVTAFGSKNLRMWDLLAGVHKIVDGERKPLTAILRDSLVNNEGSRADREMWAMILMAMTPSRVCQVVAMVKVFRCPAIKVRSTRNTIERYKDRLSNIRTQAISVLETEEDRYAKLSIAPMELLAESVRMDNSRARLYGTTACTTVRATKTELTRMNKIDPRRTRLALALYPTARAMPSYDDSEVKVMVSPHKALIEFVNMLDCCSAPYRSFGCADPKALLTPLLEKDPKELGMGEVIRALDQIWPARCTMLSNQHGNYSLRDSCFQWQVIPFQHAKHTA